MAANEAELQEKCWQLMRSVAYKRSTFPQRCAKYVSKTLQCKIDQLVSAAAKASASTPETADMEITEKVTEENHATLEEIKSLSHFNKLDENLQEAKNILQILNQISKESSCETDLVIK